jgi:hypothetical protein
VRHLANLKWMKSADDVAAVGVIADYVNTVEWKW